MTLPINKIEEFFCAEFSPADPSCEIRELNCFDGYAHWRVWFDEQQQWLHFTADKTPIPSTFPLVELGIYCSGLHIAALSGDIGTLLILRPKGEKHDKALLGITKTLEGRFSLCTTLGEIPSEFLGDIPHGWFEDNP